MRLLLFSDLHCNEKHAQNLLEKASDVDVVLGAGDFATVRRGVERTIDILKGISKPVVVVPGNNESLEELANACKGWQNAHVLHGRGVEIMGQQFFGIGGGIPVTPFGTWSYDFTEEEAQQMLEGCLDRSIIVSHSPPKGIVDVSSSGKSLGYHALYNTILQKKPKLVVCGHIHESWERQESLKDTLVVNAGPKGIVIDL